MFIKRGATPGAEGKLMYSKGMISNGHAQGVHTERWLLSGLQGWGEHQLGMAVVGVGVGRGGA